MLEFKKDVLTPYRQVKRVFYAWVIQLNLNIAPIQNGGCLRQVRI